MSYTGNHLKNALRLYRYPYGSNVTFYPDRAPYPMDEFFYDSNGRLVTDLDRDICTIRYNFLNLPDTIQFSNGHNRTDDHRLYLLFNKKLSLKN